MEIRAPNDKRVGDAPSDVPEWALRYNAKEYPRHAVTGDAVALALDRRGDAAALRALVIVRGGEPFAGLDAWPGGFMDWAEDDDTRQTAVRELREETGVEAPAYVEPLASYSANGRDPRQYAGQRDSKTGEWRARGARVTSTAYLMLMGEEGAREATGSDDAAEARWADVYDYLPWEDLRRPAGRAAARHVLRALCTWAGGPGSERRERIDYAFGFGLSEWNEERVPERYALLLEAGLVPEGRRDCWGRAEPGEDDARFGREMAFDHRRIMADALARLRGKIKYLPAALMALAGEELTLDELQAACEAIGGRPLHRANFRRAVAPVKGAHQARTPRIVTGTGRRRARGAGEPGVAPELFRFRPDAVRARLDTSLRFPWLSVTSEQADGSESGDEPESSDGSGSMDDSDSMDGSKSTDEAGSSDGAGSAASESAGSKRSAASSTPRRRGRRDA
jgi:hypothetical protein